MVSATIQTQCWNLVGMDLYIVPQNSFERKGLGLSAKQHSSLTPVNITYIKKHVTDYGLASCMCQNPKMLLCWVRLGLFSSHLAGKV